MHILFAVLFDMVHGFSFRPDVLKVFALNAEGVDIRQLLVGIEQAQEVDAGLRLFFRAVRGDAEAAAQR